MVTDSTVPVHCQVFCLPIKINLKTWNLIIPKQIIRPDQGRFISFYNYAT